MTFDFSQFEVCENVNREKISHLLGIIPYALRECETIGEKGQYFRDVIISFHEIYQWMEQNQWECLNSKLITNARMYLDNAMQEVKKNQMLYAVDAPFIHQFILFWKELVNCLEDDLFLHLIIDDAL